MQGASKIFFYEGFRKRALIRFLPRPPGCENSTAKALLFWLIKSAPIPLFCLEKFRSRALPQFLRTLSRDQLNQDVRENSSARGSKRFLFTAFVILCAPLLFSTRGFVLFDDDAQRTNSYMYKMYEGTNKKFSLAQKFINPKYQLFKLLLK